MQSRLSQQQPERATRFLQAVASQDSHNPIRSRQLVRLKKNIELRRAEHHGNNAKPERRRRRDNVPHTARNFDVGDGAPGAPGGSWCVRSCVVQLQRISVIILVMLMQFLPIYNVMAASLDDMRYSRCSLSLNLAAFYFCHSRTNG